jgi:geranylgeranyl diphosphate synthase type I
LDVEKFLAEKAVLIDKTIEKYIPRVFSENAAVFKSNPPNYAYNLQPINKAVADPIWEFLARGGKRWRPALFLLICEVLCKNPNDFVDFAIIPEVIHNGTLMVDDIEDKSELRRGKPCTYRMFGLDIAINAGNAMYYLPLLPLMEKRKEISSEKARRIYEVYTQEMINLSLGQAMDIAWHRGLANANDLDEKAYLQMCAYKTGTLARMSARIASVLADADDDLVLKLGRLAESVGIAFQMRDDVLDLTSAEFEKKKGGRGADITEGKRTLIVIHTLKGANARDKDRLIEILNKHTSNQRLRDEAIELMTKYCSIEYVKQFAKEMVKDSWQQVEKLLPDSHGKEDLKCFTEFLIERKI